MHGEIFKRRCLKREKTKEIIEKIIKIIVSTKFFDL